MSQVLVLNAIVNRCVGGSPIDPARWLLSSGEEVMIARVALLIQRGAILATDFHLYGADLFSFADFAGVLKVAGNELLWFDSWSEGGYTTEQVRQELSNAQGGYVKHLPYFHLVGNPGVLFQDVELFL